MKQNSVFSNIPHKNQFFFFYFFFNTTQIQSNISKKKLILQYQRHMTEFTNKKKIASNISTLWENAHIGDQWGQVGDRPVNIAKTTSVRVISENPHSCDIYKAKG